MEQPAGVAEPVPPMVSPRTRHARRLFAGIPTNYDLLADLLSFGQNARWRRAMVSRTRARLALMPSPNPVVLDVATGPAAVARDLARRMPAAAIVGIDQSPEMLGAGVSRVHQDGLERRVRFVLGQGERLPFGDGTFDAVMFTYLLRYVDDPATTLAELCRVLKPGGVLANLEFAVPTNPIWHGLWILYTRIGLPLFGRLVSRAWFDVGRFLGPNISAFYRRYPAVEQLAMWRRAGIPGVRAKPMSLGGGIVIWGNEGDLTVAEPQREPQRCPQREPPDRVAAPEGTGRPRRPSFYALSPGGWRDYVTLLHPPYTIWHLSYVAMGAAVAPAFHAGRLGATLLGFFLGVGITAHAFDELAGRPLRTRIPDAVLKVLGYTALAGGVGLGVLGAVKVSWWLLAFVGFGAFVVVAYNLELFGGRLHSDLWFALSWGAFPALTASFAQTGTLTWAGGIVAAACLFVSIAQRQLSTPVRRLRRDVVAVHGRMVLRDGTEVPIDERTLRAAPEAGLRAMWVAMALLATGMVVARLV